MGTRHRGAAHYLTPIEALDGRLVAEAYRAVGTGARCWRSRAGELWNGLSTRPRDEYEYLDTVGGLLATLSPEQSRAP